MYAVRWGLGALAAVVFLAGCASGPDPVASFVTADGPQYFVRPIAFRATGDTEGSALVDVTVYETRAPSHEATSEQAPPQPPPVRVNFTVPIEAARGLDRAELRSGGDEYPLDGLERLFARSDTARYGSTMPRERFDELRADPQRVELVIAAGDNGGGASAESRYAAAEPWVRRIEILNLMLAE
ncbi:MAG: hypothetical protein ACOCYB_12555 [Alkalispirochaeta sp.]